MTRFLYSVCLCITLAFIGICNTAQAQWPTNHAVNVPITSATGHQQFQKMVSDGAGGTIIMWSDERNAYPNFDVYAQRVTVDGQVSWTANGVGIVTAVGMQNFPDITKDNSGGAIIAWADDRTAPSPPGKVYAQRIDGSGVVQWAANGLTVAGGSVPTQNSPSIISDGGGGAIIAWVDSRGGGTTGNDIYVQRLNSSGVPQWTTNGVLVCSAINTQSKPLIISDNSGGAIISWIDERAGVGLQDIYTQRVNSTGVVQWTAKGVAICTAVQSQTISDMVPDGSGGAIINWQDYRNGTDLNLYAQRVDASGAVQWTADGLAICTAPNEQQWPEMTIDGNGGAIMTWSDRRDGTCCNADIYAQHVDAAGTLLWTANGLGICTVVQSQLDPTIDSDGSGGAFITWGDYRGSFDIYAQHVAGDGSSLWTPNGAPVSSATGDQFRPTVIQAGIAGGKAIFTWIDRRVDGTTYDLYAQGIFCATAPVQPPEINGPTAICSGSTNTYTSFDMSDVTSYVWTLPSGWTGSSTTLSINATANATSGDITLAAVNGCGAGPVLTKAITVNSTPATPGTISGTTPICGGTNNTYSVTAVPGATTYTWTLPAGWGGTSTTNSINAGAGVTGGSITVKASNTCGTSSTSSKTITVNNPPATPSLISGPTEILINSSNTYSITAVAGATSYTWELPDGWTGTSTTTSINTTAGMLGGIIGVQANGICGSSSQSSKGVNTNRYSQTITFSPLVPVFVGGAPFNLTATASSGLPVSYVSSNQAVATVLGTQVTILSAGSTLITASQAGNVTQYLPATSVQQTLVVNVVTGLEDPTQHTSVNVYPNPGDGIYEVHTKVSMKADAIQLYDIMGRTIDFSIVPKEGDNVFLMNISQHKKGMYFLRVKGEQGVVRIVRN